MRYLEQFERMMRWYARFQSITEGRKHTMPSECYVDEVHAFFMSCYHLKDWIKNDAPSDLKPRARRDVEGFIDSSECMSICADICNGLKHLKFDREERSRISPDLSGKEIFYNASEEIIKMKFHIETTVGRFDAFQIASDCVEAWTEFLDDARGSY